MIKTFSFFVPGVPRPKQYRQTKTGVVYSKGEVVLWERSVALAAQAAAGAGYQKMFGAVTLNLTFYLGIPKSRKELENLDPHLQDPDLTNLLKATEDGIKKILFHDDNLVWQMHLFKRWSAHNKCGVQVEVIIDDRN